MGKDGLREDEQDCDEAQASQHGIFAEQQPRAAEGGGSGLGEA